jgi:hypothetical protein
MVFNLTLSQRILRYKENGGRIEPYTIVIMMYIVICIKVWEIQGEHSNFDRYVPIKKLFL